MMRFFGSSAPSAAGSDGHFGTARAPARMADMNDVLSIFLRPGISLGFAVSIGVSAMLGVDVSAGFFETSPPAEWVESEPDDAFASGCAPQAATATAADANMTI